MIIIDGYNLMFKIGDFTSSLKSGATLLEAIREVLRGFQKIPFKMKKRMVFVFDGDKSAYGQPKEHKLFGFKVIFSMPEKTADQKILDMVRKSKNPKGLLVVTDDREIRDNVTGYRAKVERVGDFMQRLSSLDKSVDLLTNETLKKFKPSLSDSEVDD